ncbi:MAG: hypothetical protein ABIT04_09635 [Novosphingobium sp.]
MRGAAVAAGLLLAVLAFALAFLPRHIALVSGAIAALAALGASTFHAVQVEIAFAGCWASLVATAACVYWPRIARPERMAGPVLGANAGLWAGLVVATEATGLTMLAVLPVMVLMLPAAWCDRRGWGVAPRVVTSWLLAVALLVGAIPHLVIHPGYEPDHRL